MQTAEGTSLHPFPNLCITNNIRLKSCEPCRIKKKACDKQEVCGRCRKKGFTCVYSKNSTCNTAFKELKNRMKASTDSPVSANPTNSNGTAFTWGPDAASSSDVWPESSPMKVPAIALDPTFSLPERPVSAQGRKRTGCDLESGGSGGGVRTNLSAPVSINTKLAPHLDLGDTLRHSSSPSNQVQFMSTPNALESRHIVDLSDLLHSSNPINSIVTQPTETRNNAANEIAISDDLLQAVLSPTLSGSTAAFLQGALSPDISTAAYMHGALSPLMAGPAMHQPSYHQPTSMDRPQQNSSYSLNPNSSIFQDTGASNEDILTQLLSPLFTATNSSYGGNQYDSMLASQSLLGMGMGPLSPPMHPNPLSPGFYPNPLSPTGPAISSYNMHIGNYMSLSGPSFIDSSLMPASPLSYPVSPNLLAGSFVDSLDMFLVNGTWNGAGDSMNGSLRGVSGGSGTVSGGGAAGAGLLGQNRYQPYETAASIARGSSVGQAPYAQAHARKLSVVGQAAAATSANPSSAITSVAATENASPANVGGGKKPRLWGRSKEKLEKMKAGQAASSGVAAAAAAAVAAVAGTNAATTPNSVAAVLSNASSHVDGVPNLGF
ncbi:hypothetical protein HDU80_008071 [Chytriomyces hyalinus]|nr:hypothetical protein HDU80_008071 [Chytriomyces hyalinus]